MLAIVDAKYKVHFFISKLQFCDEFVMLSKKYLQVLWFNIGAEGSTNDSEVFRTSDFKRMLDEGEINFPSVSQHDALQVPYHLVGDMGFSLSNTMFTVRSSHRYIAKCQFCDHFVMVSKKTS